MDDFLGHFVSGYASIRSGALNPNELGSIFVFALATAVVSLLILFLDYVIFKCGFPNFLKFTHGTNTLKLFPLWMLGGFLGGLLGFSLGVYQATLLGIFVSAASWPSVLRTLASIGGLNQSDKEEP